MSSLGYCTDYVRRIFIRDMGMSPIAYLTDMRIRNAKKLLCENERLHYTVAEIATASGYSDISYFSRMFKKTTGLTPSEFLRAHRNDK